MSLRTPAISSDGENAFAGSNGRDAPCAGPAAAGAAGAAEPEGAAPSFPSDPPPTDGSGGMPATPPPAPSPSAFAPPDFFGRLRAFGARPVRFSMAAAPVRARPCLRSSTT